jgi:hypothetical protein
MSKEKIMVLNSRDKSPGMTNSNFTLTFNDSACQQVQKVLVKDIFIPNLFYNVNENNNTLEFVQNVVLPTNQIVTVPIGQYNVDQFIAELKTQIESKLTAGVVVAITKGATLYNLTFTFSGAVNPTNNEVIFYFTQSTMRDLIGLTATNTFSNIIVMGSPYNFRPLDFVQVHSQQLGEMHGLDGGANGYIALVETVSLADAPFGGIAYRQNSDDELASIIYEQPRNLSRVTIILRDEEGNRLSLPSNAYVSVNVKIFFD